MEFTRHYVAGIGLGVFLTGGAVVLARPLLLGGAVGIFAWLLARQYLFVRTARETVENLSVTQSLERETVSRGEEVGVGLTAELPDTAAVRLDVEADPPVAAAGSDATERGATILTGDRAATTTYSVTMPVAGSFEFAAPTVTLTDRANLFRTAVTAGEARTITVDARAPEDIHVGIGGERVAGEYGEYKTSGRGIGIDPEEIREYVPGDSLRRIDWKATARLAHPHVREFEPQIDLRTAILIDHGESMATGAEGRTKLDYARQVAISLVSYAFSEGEPLGLYAVDESGLTAKHPPSANRSHYVTVRRWLYGLDTSVSPATGVTPAPVRRSPARAQRAMDHLRADDSPFGTRLRPFFGESESYRRRVETDSLYDVTRTELVRLRGTVVTVLLTDDTNRSEVSETVKLARRRNDAVLVFLTPSVLFAETGVADVENIYDRYVNFESFRRELAGLNGVQAFEVGPRDELERLLEAAAHRRRTTTT
ncbi:DUF58 domain-containing protein [Haladaptatus salinisoli]|uniref:DUF58 domain-containing protein n=1 Tax=Haladaptatus salinisoli TaxID=2884876 RepID=UPI001D0A3B52|nr:DUF58 domain-containing protein [Haladaptatus salinisoli]